MRLLDRALNLRHSRHIRTQATVNSNNLPVDGRRHLQTNNSANASSLCSQNPQFQNASSLHEALHVDLQAFQIPHAQELFDGMPLKNVVSWNAKLSAFNKSKKPLGVCKYFVEMLRLGIIPDDYTFSIVLNAVSNKFFNGFVPQIHAHAVSLGLTLSVFVGSALIRAYAAVGDQMALNRVFDEILAKDVTSWNALVASYMELGCITEAKKVFNEMPDRNIISWTVLVNGYIANKRITKARSLFNKMSERNVVSWTVMISGYVQNEKFVDALKLFRLMVESGTRPNHFTCSSVLDACAGCSSLTTGQQVHSVILKTGIPDDVILLTSLVDMYGKSGDINSASYAFESMKTKNLMSWNSIIGSYARHGFAIKALQLFERMMDTGVWPDQVTFVNLLSACAHGGLIGQGEKYFLSMEPKYGIKPELEHYTCMVDLYGRAGELEKAEKLIKGMPFEPDVVLWGALLGACGLHSSLDIGEFAAKGIQNLKTNHPVAYTMFSKIHGERGEWNDIVELRKLMRQQHVKNQKASSWIESPLSNDNVT